MAAAGPNAGVRQLTTTLPHRTDITRPAWWRSLGLLLSGNGPDAGSPFRAPPPRPITLSAVQRQYFDDNGYLILRGFIHPHTIAAARLRLDALWRARPKDLPVVIDTFIGTEKQQRCFFPDADPSARTHPYKISDLHLHDETLQDLCADIRLISAMNQLLDESAVVMNTLLLEYGSQQDAHVDTHDMPSVTPVKKAAAWIALDPATEDNGPLFYYPKSHLLPPHRLTHAGLPAASAGTQQIIDEYQLERRDLLVEPGDVLIWHPQLLRGDSPTRDPKATRLSLVTYYATTADVAPEDRIDLGGGRTLLRKPQPVIG